MPLVPYDDICKAQALPNKENRYELQNVRDKSKSKGIASGSLYLWH